MHGADLENNAVLLVHLVDRLARRSRVAAAHPNDEGGELA